MKRDDVPSPEQLAQCEKITKDWLLTYQAVAEPYLSRGDCGDDWKIRVVDKKTNRIITEHLDPTAADGHTIMLLVSAEQNGYHRGIVDGKLNAVERHMYNICSLLGVDATMFKEYLLKGQTS